MVQHPQRQQRSRHNNARQKRHDADRDWQTNLRIERSHPIATRYTYKRRIRCWQCHESVEEAPTLFCSACGARLLWYNLHLLPGEAPVSYPYPEPEQENPPLAIIAYTRPRGIAGQYKLGALFALPYGYYPGLIEVFEDDTFDRRVNVGPYTNQWDIYSQEQRRERFRDYLMYGILPGNMIVLRLRVNEVAHEQQDMFRVTPERIVRVGRRERRLIRSQRRLGEVWIADPEQTPELVYIPLVDLDNLEESLWLEAVHQRNAKPEMVEQFLKEMRQFMQKPTYGSFDLQACFLEMHNNDTLYPDNSIKSHQMITGWLPPKEELEKSVDPVIDDRIDAVFELTNREAALIVYMDQSFAGKTVRLTSQEEKVDEKYYEYYRHYHQEVEVADFRQREVTRYAALFEHVPLLLKRHTKEPEQSTQFIMRVGAYTRYHPNSDTLPAYTEVSVYDTIEKTVFLHPGKVQTVDWSDLKYQGGYQ